MVESEGFPNSNLRVFQVVPNSIGDLTTFFTPNFCFFYTNFFQIFF